MQTLNQLRKGELKGVSRLALSEQLTEFPKEIFDLADSLEILDLSNNALNSLPDDLYRLTELRILFCSNNQFTELPVSLGQCPKLEMIGFKNNQISRVPSESLPDITRWLILTDNQIKALPSDMGRLTRLQKLALAGNELTQLPDSVKHCESLELIRVSANKLAQFPDLLLSLPRLAWLAFSGNPFCAVPDPHNEFTTVASTDLDMHQVLGQGASGVISKASWMGNQQDFPDSVAVKVFKGEVTSDGFPEDELDACLAAGDHPNLVKPLAKISEPDCSALVMELIPESYTNLGQPPSFVTCTRDTFTQGQSFSIEAVAQITEQMKALVEHFKEKRISHGDLYAHNVLINQDCHILLGDFGAASKYGHLTLAQQQGIQAIEQRALNFFIDDMLSLCADQVTNLYQELSKERLN